MGAGRVSAHDLQRGGRLGNESAHLCPLLAWVFSVSETIAAFLKLETDNYSGHFDTVCAYGGSGVGCSQEKASGDSAGAGRGPVIYEAAAGADITYHVGVLDHYINCAASYADMA